MIFNSTIAGSGGVETASVGLYAVNTFQPTDIYYTDADMTVQHTTYGSVVGDLPVGSIIYCHGCSGPADLAMMDQNHGVTALYVEASVKSLNAAYEVTG